MKLLAICLCLLLHISCQESRQSLDKEFTVKENKNKISPQQMKYINPEEVKNWSLEKIKEKYKPIQEEKLILQYGQGIISEFRIELLNIYKENDLKKGVELKEVTWEIDENNNLTIWFKEDSNHWKPVHQLIWDKGAVF